MSGRFLPLILFVISMTYIVDADARVIKIATLSPDGTAWMKSMREGAKMIKEQTEGRVVIKFYPGGVMGSDESVLRKIRIGQLHGGAVTTGSLAGIYPDIDIYGLPYLFSSQNQVDLVRDKLDQLLLSGLEDKGFVGFGLASGGFTYMMSDDILRTVDDVKNKKIWIPSDSEVGLAVFETAGVSPVPLPLADVLTGLQTGLIDTVFASPIGAIALQWHTKIKYIIDEPLTYLTALLVIDKKTFSKLKETDQSIVREVMHEVFKKIDHKNKMDNISAREALVNKGIEFISLSNSNLKVWRDIGMDAVRKLEQKNSYSKPLYDSLMKIVRSTRK